MANIQNRDEQSNDRSMFIQGFIYKYTTHTSLSYLLNTKDHTEQWKPPSKARIITDLQ